MNQTIPEVLRDLCGKELRDATDRELYLALQRLTQEQAAEKVQPVSGKKLYYISAEFLMGKLLSNNLINLGLYGEVQDCLSSAGRSLA